MIGAVRSSGQNKGRRERKNGEMGRDGGRAGISRDEKGSSMI